MTNKKYIPIAQPDLGGNEMKYINECIRSSWISSKGKYIERFENEFKDFIGTKYAVSTSNGTTALHLALVTMGIGKGDEVIVPDLTFIATANTVSYTGAEAVFVDVEKETWNLDPAKIEVKITGKTKAIIVVHLYGHPADMNKIVPIARKHNLFIIEDAAEAHGAEVKINKPIISKYLITQLVNKKLQRYFRGGEIQKAIKTPRGWQAERSEAMTPPTVEETRSDWKKVGSIGDVGCFSFYGNKIITTGEGGMIVTNDKQLSSKMKILRDHGQEPSRRYYYKVIGFNYRMTNMQAAIGCAQLERIDKFIQRKRKIAAIYNNYLSDIAGIFPPPKSSWARPVYWMYSVLVGKPYPKTRDQIIRIMSDQRIETRPFFYPLHMLPPYRDKNNFPNSDYLSLHGINLPSSTNLEVDDIYRISEVFKKYIKHR